jgi:hypothetical protein
MRNYLTIYDSVAASWWSDDIRWVRTLKIWRPADYVGLTARSSMAPKVIPIGVSYFREPTA